MPCFNGFFEKEECNEQVQDLLYVLSYFHMLIKLCLHTTSTVAIIRSTITVLGAKLCHF
jgi:hypothetical protein